MRSDAAPAVQTATSSTLGLVKPDNTTITISGGTLTVVSTGSVSPSGTITNGTVAVWATGTTIAGTQAFGTTGNNTLAETSGSGLLSNTLISALPLANLANITGPLILGRVTNTSGAISGAYTPSNGTDSVVGLVHGATTSGHCAQYNDTVGTTADSGNACAGATTLTLAAGLGNSNSTYNPGTQTVTNSSSVYPQLFYFAQTTSCTVNSTCAGSVANTSGYLVTATAGSLTFTMPNPTSVGQAVQSFGYDGTHNYTVTTVGGTAGIYGCGSTSTSITVAYPISLITDGTNYQCVPSSSGGGTPVVFVGAATGSANSYTIASPTPTGYTLVNQYVIRTVVPAAAANTGDSTLNVNSTGALHIVANTQSGLALLSGGELVAGLEYDFTYSTSSATACSSSCYVMSWLPASAVLSGGQTITAAQWVAGVAVDITTASQTVTLPHSTLISGNGAIFINTTQTATLALANAGDAINGGSAGASVTIPANVTVMVTLSSAGNYTAPLPSGASGANPTAAVGSGAACSTVTNGSAATFIRSDAQQGLSNNCDTFPVASLGYISGVTPVTGWIMASNFPRTFTITAITGTVEALAPAGTKIDVYEAPSGTACGSGTNLTNTTDFAADGTAHTDQALSGTTTTITSGDRLCWVVTGTWTSTTGVGNITVWAHP